MPRQRQLTVVVALLSMVGPFSIDTYLPSFPDIEAEFGVGRAILAQSLGVYLVAFGVATLAWGPLADRFGRRIVILGCLAVYTLASGGCAMSTDASGFLILRTLQGLAASGGFVAGRAMVRDAHDAGSAHRAMSHVMLLFALAPAVAPVLGGWLHDAWGWRSVFWFLTAFGGLLVALVLSVPETLAPEHRRSIHPLAVAGVYGRILRSGRFLALVLSLACGFGGLFLYIAGAPTVIFDFLGLGPRDFGIQFVPMVAGLMAGSALSGHLARRWPAPRTVALGLAIMALGAAGNIASALLWPPMPATVIGPLVIYTLGVAVLMPPVTVMALDCFPGHRGSASAAQGFVQMGANALIASLVVPLLHGTRLGFVLGQAGLLGGALIAAAWAVAIHERFRRRRTPPV